jgi:hypothetical protein
MASQSRSTFRGLESTSNHRERKDRYRSSEESRHRIRRRSTDTGRLQSSRARPQELGRHGQSEHSSESEEDAATQSGSVEARPVRRKTRVVYVAERRARSPQLQERRRVEDREHRDHAKHNEDSVRSGRTHLYRRASVTGAVSTSTHKRYNFSLSGYL